MLQSIRNHAQGWIAWVIVGLIILTFALFGIEQYAQGDKSVAVAEVNGEEVSSSEFVNLYNRQKVRLQQQFGDMYETVVDDEELRKQVLDALIESALIQQWAQDNGMIISDPQLAATVQAVPAFQKDGVFDQETYKSILLRNNLSIPRFEYEQRKFLLEDQYRRLSVGSEFSAKQTIEQLAHLQLQERELSYLRVDQRPFLDTVSIDDAEIAAFYEKNREQYIESEKAKFDYIELSKVKIAQGIPASAEDLEKYYQENQSLFATKEKRQAKHILVMIDENQTQEQAQAKIAEIEKKLAEGEDFSALAKEYSQDPGSAASGGDLGSFEQGMMVPEFDEAVFSMKEGEVSAPVKTEFGLHLIQLVKVMEAAVKPYDEVAAEVKTNYQNQMADQQYFDLLEQLNVLVYEQADTLQVAAESLGLSVETSDWVERSGGKGAIFSNSKVLKEAFSDPVLLDGVNSTPVELSANRAVVVRINEYKAERPQSLDEVRADILQDLTRDAAIAEAKKTAEEILPKLKAGEAGQSFMRDGIEWQTVGWIERNSNRLLPQITEEAFKVKKPALGESEWSLMQLSTGDSLLLQITGVREGAMVDEQLPALEKGINELMANAEITARLAALKESAEIEKKELYLTIK